MHCTLLMPNSGDWAEDISNIISATRRRQGGSMAAGAISVRRCRYIARETLSEIKGLRSRAALDDAHYSHFRNEAAQLRAHLVG